MKNSRGFTLVEILVAMAIAGLLLTGVYGMMIRQQVSYETQEQISGMQQDLRAVMNLMRYDLRMIAHGVPSGTPALVAALNNQPGAFNTDGVSFNANIQAATIVLPVGGAGRYTLAAGIPTVLEVASIEGFNPPDPGYGLDFIDLGTGELIGTAALSGLTATPPRLTVLSSRSITVQAGTYVGPTYQTVTYRVHTAGETPVLQRSDGAGFEDLVDGVEDFQIAYAFDGLNGLPKDGAITENGSSPNDDEWVFNTAGEKLPILMDDLRMVRVKLLLRSKLDDRKGLLGIRPTVEDHAGGSRPDGYKRRILQFNQEIRNIL